jgi:hypothetical protein
MEKTDTRHKRLKTIQDKHKKQYVEFSLAGKIMLSSNALKERYNKFSEFLANKVMLSSLV